MANYNRDSLDNLRRKWASLGALALALSLSIGSGCATSYAPAERPALPVGRVCKVACIGDSITYGVALQNREAECYPVVLAGMLGPDWQVENLGVPGILALEYMQDPIFKKLLEANPDVVVVLLGSNDVKYKWPGKAAFREGYAKLVDAIRGMPSKPRVLLCRPLPRHNGSDSQDYLSEVAAAIDEVAQPEGLEVVQLDKRFWNKPNLFADGVHPSARGARVLADEIQRALQGQAVSLGDRFRSVGEYFQPGTGLGGK